MPSRGGATDDRAQHDGLSRLYHNSTGCLFCDLTGLECEFASSNLTFYNDLFHLLIFSFLSSWDDSDRRIGETDQKKNPPKAKAFEGF